MNKASLSVFLILVMFFASSLFLHAETLEVGDGKPFDRIEDAVMQAQPGDVILIFPKSQPYRQPAILISTPRLTLRSADMNTPVVLDGTGFEYSGVGKIPRAIIQFNPGADEGLVEGLTLINARNQSFNGAGIRINAANHLTIRNCVIRNNDMGIMSGGDHAQQTGKRQRIEKCHIFDNGTEKDPGYNHNLYLGGTSVLVQDCTIERSVTGHNVKSRAHLNLLINNTIRNSANREIDLVDAAGNTDIPQSDAYLIGNTIAKDPQCQGNRGVIHFGHDGKVLRDGTLWLIGNTVSTPFVAPVVEVSSGKGTVFIGNSIEDINAGQQGILVKLRDPEMTASGQDNILPREFLIREARENETQPITLDKTPDSPTLSNN